MAENEGHDTVSAAAERTERQREPEESEQSIEQRVQNLEKAVKLLQLKMEKINLSADEAVEDNETIVTEPEDNETIITEPEDNETIVTEPEDNETIITEPEDNETIITEPESRDDFLKCSRKITLDPATAHNRLSLSDGKRKATLTSGAQSSSHDKIKFTQCYQVLSTKSLPERCYWEVEWRGEVDVAVAYETIDRKNTHGKSGFGQNAESWALRCNNISYKFQCNKALDNISVPQPSRVGVYLDHTAGYLSFYSVSETKTMTLLYKSQKINFTQPLYAGLGLLGPVGNTAELCELK